MSFSHWVSLNPEFISRLAWLATKLQGSSCLNSLSPGVTAVCCCCTQHYMWVLGIQAQAFMVAWYTFYPLSSLLSPQTSLHVPDWTGQLCPPVWCRPGCPVSLWELVTD